MTRREWVQSAGLVAGACAVDALWLEPDGIRVSHHDMMVDSTSGRHVRLIQISDLHLRAMDGHAAVDTFASSASMTSSVTSRLGPSGGLRAAAR